ncbi:hypothetical protein E2C01_075000 [Portunus trituberculatus]|uniref:Uncharacterized protein n=1 Tax=Portunus trituberculatus TaxID=210409 RepID=A0A5B7I4X1_PORTR|nr:hypothetical protein [Portunus trituberculatus]
MNTHNSIPQCPSAYHMDGCRLLSSKIVAVVVVVFPPSFQGSSFKTWLLTHIIIWPSKTDKLLFIITSSKCKKYKSLTGSHYQFIMCDQTERNNPERRPVLSESDC